MPSAPALSTMPKAWGETFHSRSRSGAAYAIEVVSSPSQTFLRVTLPQSRQAILAGIVLAGLPMFGDYFTQQLLAPVPGTRMLGNAIVDSLVVPIFVSRGAALILVMLVLLIAPILYYLRSTSRAAVESIA